MTQDKAASPVLSARDDYPNFAFWLQHSAQQSDTGLEIIRALGEIDRLRLTVDMLRAALTAAGVDPDTLNYPTPDNTDCPVQ